MVNLKDMVSAEVSEKSRRSGFRDKRLTKGNE